MDMQPLEPPPEVSPAERRRKNQQIVSRATRGFQKAKNSKHSVLGKGGGFGLASSAMGHHPHDEDDGASPVLIMMSAPDGEEEMHPGRNEPPLSPSKRSLLIKNHNSNNHNNNEDGSSSTGTSYRSNHHKLRPVSGGGSSGSSSNNTGRGSMKKHTTKRSSGSKMSSKITRALFRERKSSSHGNFSKMDSMASDAHGSHFKRSARSPFYAVEPRSSRSADNGISSSTSHQQPVGSPQPSFDNTSTSGPLGPSSEEDQQHQTPMMMTNTTTAKAAAPVSLPPGPNVRITVRTNTPPPPHAPQPQRQRQQQLQEHLSGAPATTILTAGSNISALSTNSSEFGSAASAFQTPNRAPAQPVRTMMMSVPGHHGGGPGPGGLAPSSMASSVSSLNYSESQCANSHELQRQLAGNNYNNHRDNHSNTSTGLSLVGVQLAKSAEDAELHQGGPSNSKASGTKHHPVALKTSISDLVQERRGMLQIRLLERLDQEEEKARADDDAYAAVSSTNVTRAQAPQPQDIAADPSTGSGASKIPVLKPPPTTKFPTKKSSTSKNQTKIVMDGQMDDKNGYDKYYSDLLNPGNDAATTDTAAATNHPAIITNYQNPHRSPRQQKELQRLLQGGDFIDESARPNDHRLAASGTYNSSSSATGKNNGNNNSGSGVDVARRLLQRLESDSQLMTEHHHQDPSVIMANSVASSFGSSTIATLRSNSVATTSFSSFGAAARKTSSLSTASHHSSQLGGGDARQANDLNSAQAASTTTAIATANDDNSSNPYTALMVAEGLELPSTTTTAASQQQSCQLPTATTGTVTATTAEPLVEIGEEEVEDEDELVVHQDDESGMKSLCYLYSQDKEFENSILSPGSTVYSSSVHNGSHMTYNTGGTTMSPLPAAASAASPKHMYRSDAIDAFLEKAQTNINNSCTKDHCVLHAMEQAAENVLDGGVVVEGGDGGGNDKSNPNEPTDTVGLANTVASPTVPFNEQIDSCPKEEEEASDTGIHQEGDGKTIVSDEFLNMMTSGCTGVANPSTKEAVKEKLVALEAGWSGFRSQVNERIQSLEESWQGWNLNSLLQFNSPTKAKPESEAEAEPAVADKTTTGSKELPSLTEAETAAMMTPTMMTPTTVGSSTVLTTPSTMSTLKMPNQQQPSNTGEQLEANNSCITPKTVFPEDPLQEVELISQADESVVGVMKTPMSMDETQEEVVLGVVRELERTRSRVRSLSGKKSPQDSHTVEDADGIERIGTTECDVALSLKHNLADISIIADGSSNPNQSCSSSSRAASRPPFLDSSRDDSEGGKVLLDAAEWDPVNSSAEADDEADTKEIEPVGTEVPPALPHGSLPKKSGFGHKNKSGGFTLFKRKSRSKKKGVQSPKSVFSEI